MKNNLLFDEDSDENETVSWIEETIIPNKKYYNCGCCDNCSCDDNVACDLCGCQCNCDEDIEDEYEYDGSDTEEIEMQDNANPILSNFDIMIIEDNKKDKKVRITLELNVVLSNKKSEIISVNLDISRSTYLKIAEELFN